MKISLFEILGFSKLKKYKLQYLLMTKYFEGYYCNDDDSVNATDRFSSTRESHLPDVIVTTISKL
jgi:hypothetical protein